MREAAGVSTHTADHRWIVLPVDREDFEEPHHYEPGLLLSLDGTFHRLDSELRGWGQRDFPRYEQRVSPEPVEPRADQEQHILNALAAPGSL